MKRYRVIGSLAGFASGLMQLTLDQAKTRSHNLREIDIGAGVYEVINPVEFKRGEEVGYNGQVNKLQLLDLEEVEQTKRAYRKRSETRQAE